MKHLLSLTLLLTFLFLPIGTNLSYNDPNYPIIVWQSQNQPSPSWPVIFYSPHQDDETLSMGA
ncbi:MAG: hypothetical protein HXY50_12740 [Ignavibacteriaceae bacterium]|nr:hypothetical protein [Ignavibacteriaceae bacterium]